DLGYGQLAAEPRRALQHGHPHRLVPEEERRREPGDPAAHDHHVRPRVRRLHASSLADAAWCGAPEVARGRDLGAAGPLRDRDQLRGTAGFPAAVTTACGTQRGAPGTALSPAS